MEQYIARIKRGEDLKNIVKKEFEEAELQNDKMTMEETEKRRKHRDEKI
jgi:hypothetical protein